MSLVRVAVYGTIIGLSTAVIGFVGADRVAHTTFPAPPSMTIAQAPALPAEPETTGTVTQGEERAVKKPSGMLGGFDTERLNALMRGETLPPPKKR